MCFCLKHFGQLSEWNHDAQTPNICAKDEARKCPGVRSPTPGHHRSNNRGEEHMQIFIVISKKGENIHFTDANLSIAQPLRLDKKKTIEVLI